MPPEKSSRRTKAKSGAKSRTASSKRKPAEPAVDDMVQMNLKVRRSIKRRLKLHAIRSDTSMAELVEQALEALLPDEPDA